MDETEETKTVGFSSLPQTKRGKLQMRTFSQTTIEANLDFPKNSRFESLTLPNEKSDLHFTNNYPFSFKNLDPEKHNLLMEPSEYPIPEKDNSTKLNFLTTHLSKGKQPEVENPEEFEAQLLKIAKIGKIKIPQVFLVNSNSSIPEKFEKGQAIYTMTHLDRCEKPEDVIYLNLDSSLLTSFKPTNLFQKIAKLTNLEILSLNATGLSGIGNEVFPNLRILMMCDNHLHDSSELISFVQKHEKLSLLDYRRNKIATNDSVRLEITATCVNLQYLNGRKITLRDRLAAMEHFHQQFRPKDIARIHFFLQIKNIPEVSALSRWDPTMLRHLSLPNCGLTNVCLHEFKNLQSLNLSGNAISKLDESGIVHCQYLISIDLSNNQIESFEQIELLKYLRSLLYVWLNGNKVSHYRADLIYKCRKSCGTAAMNGLKYIDGIPVSQSELLQSMLNEKPDQIKPKIPEIVTNGAIEQRIGNDAIKDDKKVYKKVRSLQLINRNITAIDVRHFKHLTHLVLKGNSFETVKGLRHCKNLRLLDVSHNKNLKIETFAEDIKTLMKLQFLMAAIDCWEPQYASVTSYDELFTPHAPTHSIRNKQHREQIIDLFVFYLPSLSSVDRTQITVEERLKVLEEHGVKPDVLEEYRCNVAIAQASVPSQLLDLRPSEVGVGKQYNPAEVVKIHLLTNCGLTTHPCLEFSKFTLLEELDLSRNHISKITTLNLMRLEKLKLVDLSYNDINEQAEEVGYVIDSIKSLQMISIRGNPVVNTQEKRSWLIKNVQRLAQPNDTLRVIDCEVSPLEIYNTHNFDGQEAQKEKILFNFALKIRLPFDVDYSHLQSLDLTNCSLSYCDITQFTELKRLILLKNNFTTHTQFIGMDKIHTLEILDLRDNKIERLETILFLIKSCPKLTNIGISGNPCANEKGYRKTILKHLPNLSKPTYPLISIDDCTIILQEILKAVGKGAIENVDKFAFDLSIYRNKTTDNILDLSNSELKSYLDFKDLKTLKLLNLRANKINSETLINSGLENCKDIEFLDLSQNNIADKKIGEFLGSNLQNLQRLEISKNPICQRKEDWKTFLVSYPQLADVHCKLQIINGHEMTLEDRVSIIKQQANSEKAGEEFRTNYILTQKSEEWTLNKAIRLSNKGIMNITVISLAKQLQFLDISNNRITTLKNQGLNRLTNLVTLDIHNNEIESLDDIRESLTDLPRLERLFMVNSTANKKETETPSLYTEYMAVLLHGLSEIDGYGNPRPLKANQLNALKDIEQLTGWNNPNHIHDIDLSNKKITLRDFPQILIALSALAPHSVDFTGNPCTSIDKYRFLIIYHVPDVQKIDGTQVSIDQRMNADKSVRTKTGASTAENLVIAGALVGAEYIDKDEREQTLGYVKIAADYAYKFGTMMMKWEIFITCQQIFSQIIALVDKVKWPWMYIDWSWVYFIFSIDLSFLDFLLDIRLPFWYQYASFFVYILIPALLYLLYHFQPNREYWDQMLTHNYKYILYEILLLFIILIIMSLGLSFLADFNYTLHYHTLTNNQYAWFGVLGVISLIVCVTLAIAAHCYHKNSDSPIVWFKTMKIKKRAALFLLTVMYFPVCKAFVDTFTCSEGHIKSFIELDCLHSIHDLTLVQVCAFIFGVVYAILIPYFFIKLINQGVKEIDLNYRIDIRLKQLDEKKKEVKKLKKQGEDIEDAEKEIKATREDIKKSYSRAAIEYENAASYLYNAYDRNNRYKKVIDMIEKLAYLLFSSFVPQKWLQNTFSTVLLGIMTLLQIITSPFNATSENVIGGTSKTSEFATLIIGDGCQFEWFGDSSTTHSALGIVLIILAAFIFVIVIYFMIVNHCCKSIDEKENSDDEDYSLQQESPDFDDDEYEYVEEEEEEEKGEKKDDEKDKEKDKGDNDDNKEEPKKRKMKRIRRKKQAPIKKKGSYIIDEDEQQGPEKDDIYATFRSLNIGSVIQGTKLIQSDSPNKSEYHTINELPQLTIDDSSDYSSSSNKGKPLKNLSESEYSSDEEEKPKEKPTKPQTKVEILDSI